MIKILEHNSDLAPVRGKTDWGAVNQMIDNYNAKWCAFNQEDV